MHVKMELCEFTFVYFRSLGRSLDFASLSLFPSLPLFFSLSLSVSHSLSTRQSEKEDQVSGVGATETELKGKKGRVEAVAEAKRNHPQRCEAKERKAGNLAQSDCKTLYKTKKQESRERLARSSAYERPLVRLSSFSQRLPLNGARAIFASYRERNLLKKKKKNR